MRKLYGYDFKNMHTAQLHMYLLRTMTQLQPLKGNFVFKKFLTSSRQWKAVLESTILSSSCSPSDNGTSSISSDIFTSTSTFLGQSQQAGQFLYSKVKNSSLIATNRVKYWNQLMIHVSSTWSAPFIRYWKVVRLDKQRMKGRDFAKWSN